MPAIAGLRGTGDWAADERPKDFREYIMWRQPNGDTPITALSSKIGKESTSDPEFNWWDESVDILRLQVNGALVAADTVVVVDSTDPDTSAPASVWGTATHLVPGDILMVEPVADAAVFNPEYLRVTQVQSATSFSVERGVGGGAAAGNIADNAFLLKVGSAFAEGSPSPQSASRNPTKYTNYCQIFKTVYELTQTAVVTGTRTGDPLANDKKRKMFDHARDIEFSLMFGKKYETVGTNGKPLRFTGGIRSFIPSQNTTIFAAPITISTFLDATYKVFDYATPGGDTRFAFTGNKALNRLNKMIQTDANTSIHFGPQIKFYGMTFQEFILPQGRILLRTHPLLNRHSLYNDSMWLVDFSALKWRHMKGRDGKFKDDIQAPDEDTRKGQWLTEGGLEVRFGGLSLGYLGNMSAA